MTVVVVPPVITCEKYFFLQFVFTNFFFIFCSDGIFFPFAFVWYSFSIPILFVPFFSSISCFSHRLCVNSILARMFLHFFSSLLSRCYFVCFYFIFLCCVFTQYMLANSHSITSI